MSLGPRTLTLQVIAFAINVLALASFAQQTKVLAPHRPIAPRVSEGKELPLPPGKLSSVVGGPWMVDANFKSAIYIKNVVELYAVTVTPVLYLSNGTRYKLPDVKLDPAGTAIVDVNAALDSLGLASYATLSGYVELQYNFPWLPICAFIRNVDTVHSMIFLQGVQLLPAELLVGASSQPAIKQQVLEGMWWKHEPNVTGFVTLSNTSTRPIAATVETNDSAGKAFAAHNVTISANGTKIVPMTELASAPQTEGGIRVTYNGPQDALIANGGLEDASVGYSANMHFLAAQANPKVSPLSAVELGLMTGIADPMMSFPAGTKFTPYSLLRNTSSAPAVVTPTLWWMQAGSARSFSLSALTLQPFQTRRLDVPSMLSAAGLKNFTGSFNINFDIQGVAGAVLQAAGSVDQTNTYVFEVNARGIGVSGSRSLPYWSTGNGDDTMMTIWNPADEAQDFVLKLFFSGGQYGFPIHLGARATQTLNFSEIIQNQVPDVEGNIIPAGIHEGSAVVAGSIADNQVILFAADLGIYNVRKAICGSPTCFTCNGISAAAIAANPFAVPVAGQTQLKLTVTMNNATQYDNTNSATWSSNHTPVATVQTGLTKGVSAGSATISAFVGSGPVYAQEICSPGVCPTADPEPQSPGTVFQVTHVAPSPFVEGTSGPMAVGGSGFKSVSGTVGVQFDGTGISATNVTVQDDQNISAQFNVAANAPVGQQNLTVVFTQFDGGSVPSNPFPVSVTATAPVPKKAVILSQPKQTYANQTWTSCDGTQSQTNVYGYQRCVTYQIEDASGNAISENFTVSESVSVVDPGNIIANLNTGDSSSNPVGVFLDGLVLLGKTSTSIPSNACEIVKQSFTATGSTGPIRVNCLKYGTTDVTITDVSSNPGLCVKGTTYHCN